MKLAIISDCVHVQTTDGKIGSDVHIFVRQMEALAEYFTEVNIFCPFVQYNSNTPITTYSSKKIKSFTKLKRVGGNNLLGKLEILVQLPSWFKAYIKASKNSDIVYQRFPNNINLPGLFYFRSINKKVFGTYTGTWEKNDEESKAYTLVKWLLKNIFKGPVGVYSTDDNLNGRIFKSFSPSYNQEEWMQEIENVNAKVEEIANSGITKLKLVSVGALEFYKNQQYILDTCLLLKQKNILFELTIIGDGSLRKQFEDFIVNNQLENEVRLMGKLNYQQVREVYRKSNFVVQAPVYEGFGKVPIEGYFHGVIPIINNIAMAEFITQNNSIGYLFNAQEKHSLFNILQNVSQNPQEVATRINNGRSFVKQFTLESWAKEYYDKVTAFYNLKKKN